MAFRRRPIHVAQKGHVYEKTQDQKPSFGPVVDMVLSLNRLDVPVYAANAAYFIILAAFPTVMLLLNLLSYTSLGGGALLEILEKVIPSALMPSITRLLTGMFASSSKTLVSVSALAALWAASRGIFGMHHRSQPNLQRSWRTGA